MKKIDLEKIKEKNDFFIDDFIGGLQMEFIPYGDNFMIKNSNGKVITKKEKLELEKQGLALKDIKSNDCQQKTTRKIKAIEKEIKEEAIKDEDKIIQETETTI